MSLELEQVDGKIKMAPGALKHSFFGRFSWFVVDYFNIFAQLTMRQSMNTTINNHIKKGMKNLLLLLFLIGVMPIKAQTTDPLMGKTIGVIGDSYVKNHRDSVQNTWHYKFAKKHGMTYYNYGRNGNCITVDLKKWGPSILSRYTSMAPSLDYVVVIAGHNDCDHIDSIGIDTFKSRLDSLCRGLIDRYPQSQILFFTPWTCPNFKGSTREKVVDAMLDVCGANGIPVFDSARKSGIYVCSEKFRRLYFQGGGKRDFAHLNAKGHDRFLPVAEAFMLQHLKP